FTSHAELIVRSRPKAIVLAERQYEIFREALPEVPLVWLRHGFASKNNFAPSVSGCDFACVNSEWVKEQCLLSGLSPREDFWVTGFVPADEIFAPAGQIQKVLMQAGLSFDRKTLLYAPTYNEMFNSFEVLGCGWIDALFEHFGRINLIIKPHPVTPALNPAWMDCWRQAQARHDSVYLVEDTHSSIYSYFQHVDVLISDASSVMFYFLALDRPIVLVTNSKRTDEKSFYDPTGPEWTWRDLGLEVFSLEQLINALERCLNDPHANSEKRKYYAARVFGDLTDGRSAKRVAGNLERLLAHRKNS
ncbi:MAG: CDP-glycerol glycerophosphotransferase family protein, partial [Candidatus Melainabacteria bacterium]|nr:CDP-glycerol glycerophosphotransferase family protein [Candidatus Melainabacteria bacterium]